LSEKKGIALLSARRSKGAGKCPGDRLKKKNKPPSPEPERKRKETIPGTKKGDSYYHKQKKFPREPRGYL